MSRLARALVFGCLLWTALLVAAPFAAASANPSLAHAGALVYFAGAFVCHQRPERSFHLAGAPLPVCARCTGLYVSALAGGLAALVLSTVSMTAARARWLLGLAAVPTLVTVVAELFGLAHPPNVVRAISALPLGAAAAWAVVSIARRDGIVPGPRAEI
jgi:uncharacterized membrane protein